MLFPQEAKISRVFSAQICYDNNMYYNSLNSYLRQTFGCKVYKLALDGGMTCPNRDGSIGDQGCIFCSELGSGEFAAPVCRNIGEQIENAKQLVAHKNRGGKYIAYFQSFTNTYAPLEHLERIYSEAVDIDDIVALSIATRPDCLPPDVISLLSRLNDKKPIWVELGLQTMHKRTADYIRRGYENDVYESAVEKLKSAGIYVITHQILCLPWETTADMIKTTEYIAAVGSDGIKFHLLHVLKGTALELEYNTGRIILPEIEEYITILEECIKHLPKHITIHRLTGDGAKSKLVAPLWTADKKRVLNRIKERFLNDDLIQGLKFKNR